MKRQLKEKLRRAGVATAYLFGSNAERRSSPLSDIDIGILLRNHLHGSDFRAQYQAIYEILSEMFDPDRLHIVFLQESPLPLQYAAIQGGKVLFEEDSVFARDYENEVVNMYLDFKPVLALFNETNLKRHAEA